VNMLFVRSSPARAVSRWLAGGQMPDRMLVSHLATGKRDDDGDFSQRDARAAEQNGGSRRSEKGASAAQLLVQL
jgi:hypothetical protein